MFCYISSEQGAEHSNLIIFPLKELNIHKISMVALAQSYYYDGANVMSGTVLGKQTRIRDKYP